MFSVNKTTKQDQLRKKKFRWHMTFSLKNFAFILWLQLGNRFVCLSIIRLRAPLGKACMIDSSLILCLAKCQDRHSKDA